MGMEGQAGSDRLCIVDCQGGEVLTKQEFKDECDVNLIIERCMRGGYVPPASVAPVFADVSEIGDFSDCMRRVKAAEEAFMLLPAKTRSFFSNDPRNLMAFLNDTKNRDKAIELGLIDKPVVKDPLEVPPKRDPAAKAAPGNDPGVAPPGA